MFVKCAMGFLWIFVRKSFDRVGLASGRGEGEGKPFPWDIGSDVFGGLGWLEVSTRLIASGLC